MKRSRVNEIMAAADDLIRHYGFVLPPFANWSPAEFKANAHRARRVIDGRCGWDITDYGQGRFDDLGLFLCIPMRSKPKISSTVAGPRWWWNCLGQTIRATARPIVVAWCAVTALMCPMRRGRN